MPGIQKYGQRTLGIIALIGLIASLIAHLATFTNTDVTSVVPWVFALHFGVFVVFGPFVFIARRKNGGSSNWRDLSAGLPRWVGLVLMGLAAYAALNFILMLRANSGLSPQLENGHYGLFNHGRLVSEITQAQYATARNHDLRGFSGHWMIFYSVAAAYFLFWKKPSVTA